MSDTEESLNSDSDNSSYEEETGAEDFLESGEEDLSALSATSNVDNSNQGNISSRLDSSGDFITDDEFKDQLEQLCFQFYGIYNASVNFNAEETAEDGTETPFFETCFDTVDILKDKRDFLQFLKYNFAEYDGLIFEDLSETIRQIHIALVCNIYLCNTFRYLSNFFVKKAYHVTNLILGNVYENTSKVLDNLKLNTVEGIFNTKKLWDDKKKDVFRRSFSIDDLISQIDAYKPGSRHRNQLKFLSSIYEEFLKIENKNVYNNVKDSSIDDYFFKKCSETAAEISKTKQKERNNFFGAVYNEFARYELILNALSLFLKHLKTQSETFNIEGDFKFPRSQDLLERPVPLGCLPKYFHSTENDLFEYEAELQIDIGKTDANLTQDFDAVNTYEKLKKTITGLKATFNAKSVDEKQETKKKIIKQLTELKSNFENIKADNAQISLFVDYGQYTSTYQKTMMTTHEASLALELIYGKEASRKESLKEIDKLITKKAAKTPEAGPKIENKNEWQIQLLKLMFQFRDQEILSVLNFKPYFHYSSKEETDNIVKAMLSKDADLKSEYRSKISRDFYRSRNITFSQNTFDIGDFGDYLEPLLESNTFHNKWHFYPPYFLGKPYSENFDIKFKPIFATETKINEVDTFFKNTIETIESKFAFQLPNFKTTYKIHDGDSEFDFETYSGLPFAFFVQLLSQQCGNKLIQRIDVESGTKKKAKTNTFQFEEKFYSTVTGDLLFGKKSAITGIKNNSEKKMPHLERYKSFFFKEKEYKNCSVAEVKEIYDAPEKQIDNSWDVLAKNRKIVRVIRKCAHFLWDAREFVEGDEETFEFFYSIAVPDEDTSYDLLNYAELLIGKNENWKDEFQKLLPSAAKATLKNKKLNSEIGWPSVTDDVINKAIETFEARYYEFFGKEASFELVESFCETVREKLVEKNPEPIAKNIFEDEALKIFEKFDKFPIELIDEDLKQMYKNIETQIEKLAGFKKKTKEKSYKSSFLGKIKSIYQDLRIKKPAKLKFLPVEGNAAPVELQGKKRSDNIVDQKAYNKFNDEKKKEIFKKTMYIDQVWTTVRDDVLEDDYSDFSQLTTVEEDPNKIDEILFKFEQDWKKITGITKLSVTYFDTAIPRKCQFGYSRYCEYVEQSQLNFDKHFNLRLLPLLCIEKIFKLKMMEVSKLKEEQRLNSFYQSDTTATETQFSILCANFNRNFSETLRIIENTDIRAFLYEVSDDGLYNKKKYDDAKRETIKSEFNKTFDNFYDKFFLDDSEFFAADKKKKYEYLCSDLTEHFLGNQDVEEDGKKTVKDESLLNLEQLEKEKVTISTVSQFLKLFDQKSMYEKTSVRGAINNCFLFYCNQ